MATPTPRPLPQWKPTEEEIKQQQVRMLLQQRASLAQVAMSNILAKDGMVNEPEEIAEYAVKMADALMEQLYKPKEEECSTSE